MASPESGPPGRLREIFSSRIIRSSLDSCFCTASCTTGHDTYVLRMFSSVDCSSIKASSLRTASAKEDGKRVTSLEVAIEAAAALIEKRGKF
jgi:hypothetical protein